MKDLKMAYPSWFFKFSPTYKLKSLKIPKPITIKVTGGLTAQLLSLMCAIYLSQKFKRPFQMRYFSNSTGTYWPLEIEKLLQPFELESIIDLKHIRENNEISPGSYIEDFPLRKRKINYYNLLRIIYRTRIDRLFRKIRGEYVIGGKIELLKRIPRSVKSVTGIFPPVLDSAVITEMSKRIEDSGHPNPMKNVEVKMDLVIHYRLGDMRKMPARNSEFGGHGVVDPLIFKEVIEKFQMLEDNSNITVVSDEPKIAIKLLEEVGLQNLQATESNNPWENLKTIASARNFIGSLSQFSTFGAILCFLNGGRVFLPSSVYGKGSLNKDFGINEFDYIEYKYLKHDHWIFHSKL